MSKLSRALQPAAVAVVLATAVATLPASASSQPDLAAAPDERSRLQEALDAVPAAGAPGAFAEVRGGGRAWAGAAGIADLSNARPMRPWMRHRVGSITKTFVATTVLQLAGEGRLGLDDPIGRWLPELVPGDLGQRVTVRMLLNHTSGIGNYTDALFRSLADIDRMRTTTYSPEQLVAMGLELPPTGEPGAVFSYSNTGYILAGLLIRAVTGNDPADEVTSRIIRPLRLADTYFPGTDPRIRGPHAGAYFALRGVVDFSSFNMSGVWMAGELISTTDDLNDFFAALLGGRLLTAEMLAQMRTTVPFDPAQPAAGGYGLGIFWVAMPCGPVWGHDGEVVGQATVSWHLPDAGRQSSFAMNLTGFRVPNDVHPIDAAWPQFMVAALCPQASSAGVPDLSVLDRLRGKQVVG